MIDEKPATIAVVLRDKTDVIREWIEKRPSSLEIVRICHHDEGILILSLDELSQLRQDFAGASWSTRHKVRRAIVAQVRAKAAERNQKPITTPSEAKAKEAKP